MLDQQFSEKYTIFARYIYNGLTNGNSLGEFLPGVGGLATSQQLQNGAIGLVATLRPNLVNQFRAGVNRADVAFTCNGVSTLDKYSTPDQFGFGTDYVFVNSLNVPLIVVEAVLPVSAARHLGIATVKPGAPGPGTSPTTSPRPSDTTISNWALNSAISTTTDSMRSDHARESILRPLGTLGFRL